MIATILAWLLVVGMALLGVGALIAPGPLSAIYGAAQSSADGHAWVRAAGTRDLALDVGIAAALLAGSDSTVAALAFATAGVAVADAIGVLALHKSPPWMSLGVHISGALMGALVGLLHVL